MKLDLEDGRVISLPDEVSDEFARALKALILTTEGRARDAEGQVAALRAEMQSMRSQPAAPRDESLAQAIGELRAVIEQQNELITCQTREFCRAALADRVIVQDEFGEFRRSRAVPR
jgi:hypothetical protein